MLPRKSATLWGFMAAAAFGCASSQPTPDAGSISNDAGGLEVDAGHPIAQQTDGGESDGGGVDAGNSPTGYSDGGCFPGTIVILGCSALPDGGGAESTCLGPRDGGCAVLGPTPYCRSPCNDDQYGTETTGGMPGPACQYAGQLFGGGQTLWCCRCSADPKG